MVMYLPPLRERRTLCVRMEPCSAPVMICGSDEAYQIMKNILKDELLK